ncbi:DR2241 family protein [Halobaculum sp. CBA1158]|uniref:DR2241 family protein n=1 Tax=Halobaculum sp. CBA1158 TaxID=2904243 RepID=UPI002AA2A4B3|nr:DR2241 family protein [Halobaculum sp. CBA1158]
MLARQFDALLEAAESDGGVDFDGLHVARGDDGGYTFATPEHEATDLSESELHAHADGSPHVTNWYFWEREVRRHGSPRRAFLRHAEAADDHAVHERYDALADGMVTEWGQLRIEATVVDDGDGGEVAGDDAPLDGSRRYDVRHVADADHQVEELETYDDPLEARELSKHDDDGMYRPLKTGANMPTGWVFTDLDWRDAVETVELLYPATVANWYREREGTLDIDHWTDTTDRQTGIYGVVSELPREAVEWVAEAACDDSQCVKRREWEYDAGDELAADGGTGAFPCREPCSLVIAAARRWTKLEEEEPREYTFHLTPSEKEQIEGIVDAVADGRVDEIREADVYEDANRYRTRYLRAKLFDDDGNLGGVATEPETHGHDDHDHDDHDGDADHDHDGDGDHDDHDDHDGDADHDHDGDGDHDDHDDHDGDGDHDDHDHDHDSDNE